MNSKRALQGLACVSTCFIHSKLPSGFLVPAQLCNALGPQNANANANANANVCMYVHACMFCLRIDLAADDHDVGAFEAECQRVEQHLLATSEARAEMLAQQFHLPSGARLEAERRGYRLPEGSVLSTPVPEPGDDSLQAALTRAAENLGSFPGQLDIIPIDNLKTSRRGCKT